MANPATYCEFVENFDNNNVHKIYHDTEYGFPIDDDNDLFGRLILEINQAGLSWTTILNKKESFRKAYSSFKIEDVASYKDSDINRLLQDKNIIRNKLKINAAIHNAQVISTLKKDFGSFKNWLENHLGMEREEWVALFKETFKFTGGEITNEFLLSSGYLRGAHSASCPIHAKIKQLNPPWSKIDMKL